jgi:hypothetical protein
MLVNTDHLSEKLTRSLAFFCGHRKLKPFFGYPEPRFLVERTVCPASMLSGFFSLLSESGGIVGHGDPDNTRKRIGTLSESN